MKWIVFIFLAGVACQSANRSSNWEASLAVSQTGGTSDYPSSSQLLVSWDSPEEDVDHYLLTATESVGSTSVEMEVESSLNMATLVGLKSGTEYSVSLTACLDSDCVESIISDDAVEGTTEVEYWQLQGSGDSVSELTPIVSDGNSKISALFYGEGAGESLEGKIQLYYGPLGSTVKGLAVGLLTGTAEETISSVIEFTALSGSAGLISPSTSTSLIDEVNTGQGIPLSGSLGEKIRLFFEATGSDNKTRILYLDSQDGYVGRDFNADSSDSVCNTSTEYETEGGCEPAVAIGVEGDTVQGNTGVENARQFKIGYPTLDDWRWNGSDGTFMIFTLETDSSCSSSRRTQGYATWDGTNWNVQYDETSTSCPKLFENMQAPTMVHLGEARYKLYFGDPSITTGVIDSSSLPFLGPKKVMYADGTATGDADLVEFEDWENEGNARGVHFLWPSGAEMDDTDEGYIDDFMMLTPTQNLDFQVMYLVLTDGSIAPIAVAAFLLNP